MPLQRTKAIVIRTQNLGEADKIITFFTPYLGKVSAVARSVRRPKSRFGGSLELLNYGELVFFERPNKDLHIINSFDTIDTFSQLKEELTKTSYCFYIAELVGIVVSESNQNPIIFQLLLHLLPSMYNTDQPKLLIHAFELKLLILVGYKPELNRCVICNNSTDKLNSTELNFIPHLGGIACIKCSSNDQSAIRLSKGSCALMKSIQYSRFSDIYRFRASEQNFFEIREVISAFIEYYFEKKIRSWTLIDDIAGDKKNTTVT